VFLKTVSHFKRKFQREGNIADQPLVVSENYSDYPFMWYENIGSMFFSVSSQSTRVTDGQTDGRTDRQTDRRTADRKNYDAQDSASIAASRGNKIRLHTNLSLTVAVI